jgi:hypothetical protein
VRFVCLFIEAILSSGRLIPEKKIRLSFIVAAGYSYKEEDDVLSCKRRVGRSPVGARPLMLQFNSISEEVLPC